MIDVRSKTIIKVMAGMLIITFLAQDIVWANPDAGYRVVARDTLQIPLITGTLRADTVKTLIEMKLQEIVRSIPLQELKERGYSLVVEERGEKFRIRFNTDAEGRLIAHCNSVTGQQENHIFIVNDDLSTSEDKPFSPDVAKECSEEGDVLKYPHSDVAHGFMRTDGNGMNLYIDVTDLFEGTAPSFKGKNVLVMGCGGGATCFKLALEGAGKVTGIDIDENSIAIAKTIAPYTRMPILRNVLLRPQPSIGFEVMDILQAMENDPGALKEYEYSGPDTPEFITADARDLSCFQDNSFDYVVIPFMIGVLNGLQDKDVYYVIKEALRVIRPGGILYIEPFSRNTTKESEKLISRIIRLPLEQAIAFEILADIVSYLETDSINGKGLEKVGSSAHSFVVKARPVDVVKKAPYEEDIVEHLYTENVAMVSTNISKEAETDLKGAKNLSEVLAMLPDRPLEVLDIGTGNGEFCDNLANMYPGRFRRIIGIDKMMGSSTENETGGAKISIRRNMPLEEFQNDKDNQNRFDIVFSNNTEIIRQHFAEILPKILKPGGIAILTFNWHMALTERYRAFETENSIHEFLDPVGRDIAGSMGLGSIAIANLDGYPDTLYTKIPGFIVIYRLPEGDNMTEQASAVAEPKPFVATEDAERNEWKIVKKSLAGLAEELSNGLKSRLPPSFREHFAGALRRVISGIQDIEKPSPGDVYGLKKDLAMALRILNSAIAYKLSINSAQLKGMFTDDFVISSGLQSGIEASLGKNDFIPSYKDADGHAGQLGEIRHIDDVLTSIHSRISWLSRVLESRENKSGSSESAEPASIRQDFDVWTDSITYDISQLPYYSSEIQEGISVISVMYAHMLLNSYDAVIKRVESGEEYDYLPKIKIRISLVDAGEGELVLRGSLEDNGAGVSEAALQQLMEEKITTKSVQASDGTNQKISASDFGGVGLGVLNAISKLTIAFPGRSSIVLTTESSDGAFIKMFDPSSGTSTISDIPESGNGHGTNIEINIKLTPGQNVEKGVIYESLWAPQSKPFAPDMAKDGPNDNTVPEDKAGPQTDKGIYKYKKILLILGSGLLIASFDPNNYLYCGLAIRMPAVVIGLSLMLTSAILYYKAGQSEKNKAGKDLPGVGGEDKPFPPDMAKKGSGAGRLQDVERIAEEAYKKFEGICLEQIRLIREELRTGQYEKMTVHLKEITTAIDREFKDPRLKELRIVTEDMMQDFCAIQLFIDQKNDRKISTLMDNAEEVFKGFRQLAAAGKILEAGKARVSSGVFDVSKVLGKGTLETKPSPDISKEEIVLAFKIASIDPSSPDFSDIIGQIETIRRHLGNNDPPEFIERFIREDMPLSFVALQEGAVAGYLLADDREDEVYIDLLEVEPDMQNGGIGSSLLATAIRASRENGNRSIRLHVERKNKGAIRLYRRFGFKEDPVMKAKKLPNTIYILDLTKEQIWPYMAKPFAPDMANGEPGMHIAETAEGAEKAAQLAKEIKNERQSIAKIHKHWPAAITTFGSARIPSSDPMHAKAKEFGAAVYKAGLAIRTGAGPSLMEAPLQGYVEAREKAGDKKTRYNMTQGVRITLPFEQKTSRYVEDRCIFKHFVNRKHALYDNCLGIAVFPGGFGTLDEMLEVWSRQQPMVLIGKDYWEPIINTIYEKWRHAGWRDKIEVNFIITDSVDEAIEYLRSANDKIEMSPLETTDKAGSDIEPLLVELYKWPAAVTIVGQSEFTDRKEADIIAQTASRLVSSGVAVRSGTANRYLKTVLENAAKGNEDKLQAVLAVPPGTKAASAERKISTANIADYQILLAENSLGYVFLPGRIKTLSRLFDLVSTMQTGKAIKRPIVLVGREFWQPIKDAIINGALNYPTAQLIKPQDADLLQIVDTSDEVLEILGFGGDLAKPFAPDMDKPAEDENRPFVINSNSSFEFEGADIEQGEYEIKNIPGGCIYPEIEVSINDRKYKVGNGFYIVITLVNGKKIYWSGQHNLSYAFFFKHYGKDAQGIIDNGGVIWRHVDSSGHLDLGHYSSSSLSPKHGIDPDKEIEFGINHLTGGNYLGYALTTGIVSYLYRISGPTGVREEILLSECVPGSTGSLAGMASKNVRGGVSDIDIDIAVNGHAEINDFEAVEKFEKMKDVLCDVAEQGDVCFITNSSELSTTYLGVPLYIDPHKAVQFSGEIIAELAKRSLKPFAPDMAKSDEDPDLEEGAFAPGISAKRLREWEEQGSFQKIRRKYEIGKHYDRRHVPFNRANVRHKAGSFFCSELGKFLRVDPDVYVPSPFLTSFTADEIGDDLSGQRILDLGTGTGVFGLIALKRGASGVVFADIKTQAIACAKNNAARLGYNTENTHQMEFACSDLFFGLAGEEFDLIMFTPSPVDGWDFSVEGGYRYRYREYVDAFFNSVGEHLAPSSRIVFRHTVFPEKAASVTYSQQIESAVMDFSEKTGCVVEKKGPFKRSIRSIHWDRRKRGDVSIIPEETYVYVITKKGEEKPFAPDMAKETPDEGTFEATVDMLLKEGYKEGRQNVDRLVEHLGLGRVKAGFYYNMLHVRTAADEIRLIISEFMLNREHTGEGSDIKIFSRLTEKSGSGPGIDIVALDNGRGISNVEDAVDTHGYSTARDPRGRGKGLKLIRRIALEGGGSLEVSSRGRTYAWGNGGVGADEKESVLREGAMIRVVKIFSGIKPLNKPFAPDIAKEEAKDVSDGVKLKPKRIFNQSPDFLAAVDYFNDEILVKGDDGDLIPIDWGRIMDLYEIFRGDRKNADYTPGLRQARMEFSYAARVVDAANSRFSEPAAVLDQALQIYKLSLLQLFVDQPGFREKAIETHQAGDEPHPASGHNRLAWFLMNYFLIRNGYQPFYFKNEDEYNESSIYMLKMKEMVRERVIRKRWAELQIEEDKPGKEDKVLFEKSFAIKLPADRETADDFRSRALNFIYGMRHARDTRMATIEELRKRMHRRKGLFRELKEKTGDNPLAYAKEDLVNVWLELLNNAHDGMVSRSLTGEFTGNGIVEFKGWIKDGMLISTIEDHGSGVAIQPNGSLAVTSKTREQGFLGRKGIGAKLAEAIVVLKGGEIEWKNLENGGTRVVVKIPANILKTSGTILGLYEDPLPQSPNDTNPALKPVQFLRDIVDTKELTQNMIEGILSALFSNKKLTLAFSKKLKGLESAELRIVVRRLKEWKEATAQNNKRMKALLGNLTILEYDDLRQELADNNIDANARGGLIFTYAPKPADESENTANIGSAVRPVYIIEQDGEFPVGYYYPLLEMVTISLAKELLQWDENQLRKALLVSKIAIDTLGLETAVDEKFGILIFKVLPKIERYNNNSRVDRYTKLLQFLRSA